MSQELSLIQSQSPVLTKDKIEVLEQAGIIPLKTPPAQIAVFAEVCNRHGFDPFLKEVHLVGYNGRYSVIVGIDAARSRAEESGQHAGTDEAKFNMDSTGQWQSAAEAVKKSTMPTSATVTVYKVVGGMRVPFTHTALFKEFSTGKNKWATMPFQMLAKVAESHALRKAFPRALKGLHIEEEIGAITETVEPEYREVTPEEEFDTKCRERINDFIRGMVAEDKKPVSDAFRANWNNKEWRQPVEDKIKANELTEKFLINYCKGIEETGEDE